MKCVDKTEARAILRDTLLELEARGPGPLFSLEQEPEHHRVVATSGMRYNVFVSAFWDADPWESWLYVEAAVRPDRSGWRRWRVKSGLTVDPVARDIVRNHNFPD